MSRHARGPNGAMEQGEGKGGTGKIEEAVRGTPEKVMEFLEKSTTMEVEIG